MGILQYILDRAEVPGIVFEEPLELMDCRLTTNHVSLDGLNSDEKCQWVLLFLRQHP